MSLNFFIHILCLLDTCKVLKGYTEGSVRSLFHKVYTISHNANTIQLELQSCIPLAILILQSLFSIANRTEVTKDANTDRLQTVYPLNYVCGGSNDGDFMPH